MPTDSTAPPCVGGNHMVGPIRVAAVDECLGRDEEGGVRDATVVWVEGLHSGWNARKCGWDRAEAFKS